MREGIRHFPWNSESQTDAIYRGIPGFSAISTGNLQNQTGGVLECVSPPALSGVDSKVSSYPVVNGLNMRAEGAMNEKQHRFAGGRIDVDRAGS